jgi:hypothetical protein
MANTPFLQRFAGGDNFPPTKIDSLVASVTAGTRNTVAHGLGYTPKVVIPVCEPAADADGAIAAVHGAIAIVSIGATNIVTRAEIASQPYSLICF